MKPDRAPARRGRYSPAGSAPRSGLRRTPRGARRTPTPGGRLRPPPRVARAPPPPRSPQGRTDTRSNVPREPLPSDSETHQTLWRDGAQRNVFRAYCGRRAPPPHDHQPLHAPRPLGRRPERLKRAARLGEHAGRALRERRLHGGRNGGTLPPVSEAAGGGHMAQPNRLTPYRFVLAFGVVSMLGDFVYEGGRSIAGPYLATLGASATLVGVVSGAGEAVALVLRLWTGPASDRTGRHWALAIVGYGITMVSVPLMAVAHAVAPVSALVVSERFGKAVRSPARDT